jgi:hypothetical protein
MTATGDAGTAGETHYYLQRQRPGRGACRAAGKPNFHSTYYELAVAIARTSTTGSDVALAPKRLKAYFKRLAANPAQISYSCQA